MKRLKLFIFILISFSFISYCTIFPQPPVYFVMKSKSNSIEKQEIEDRRRHLLKACQNLQGVLNLTKETELFYCKPMELQFCAVPKCGSTYWIRVFKALTEDTNKSDPFYLSRKPAHHGHFVRESSSLQRNNTFRFILTRSPYSRLYSAYVDKLVLAEKWSSVGCKIVRFYRRNPTESSLRCGYDVTFPEFLNMITNQDPTKKTLYDVHWSPIERFCNPCKIKYDFIVKHETFTRDRDYLISKLGIKERSIQNYNNLTHMQFALNSIYDVTYTTYRHFTSVGKSKPICFKIDFFLNKIFNVLQIQGYIRSDAILNLGRFGDLKNISIENIVQVFQDICREFPVLTREEWQEQRRMFMINAYREIDKDVLERIKEIYYYDFQIFDYDMDPKEIFGYRKT